MSRGNAGRDAATMDLLALDHYPTCPRCGDLCARGSSSCDCGAHLLVGPLGGTRNPRAGNPVGLSPAEPPDARDTRVTRSAERLSFSCGNCHTDHDEPFCPSCAANLMEAK